LFYFIVDFECFINIEHCYPENSWLLNYFQIVKEGFEKDCPIQNLEVGESFTVVATTNRVYLWGLNIEFNTLEKPILIKPQKESRVEKVNIIDNKLEITYEGMSTKEPINTSSTVAKAYTIESGKLY
jgi:hypothetical protein